MSLSKIVLLASAAAFMSSAAFAHSIPLRASDTLAPGSKVSFPAPNKKGVGLCGTGFGSAPPTPNGIIAWNDTSGTGENNAGAADFECKKATTIKEVDVYGYNAPNNPEQYNVSIYTNDKKDGSNEANDGKKAVCSYTGLSAEGGGSYPTAVLSHIKLSKACKLKKKGEYWVSVQNNDSAGPWYWEIQSTTGGTDVADWVDRNNSFGTGCTTLDNDAYLVNCLGYTYPDWMLELH